MHASCTRLKLDFFLVLLPCAASSTNWWGYNAKVVPAGTVYGHRIVYGNDVYPIVGGEGEAEGRGGTSECG